MVVYVQRIIVGEMSHRVVIEPIAAEILVVTIQYHVITARGYKEAIVGEASRGREIENEEQLTPHKCQHLIAVIVPYLLHGGKIEVLLALDYLQHFLVEVAQVVVAKLFVVNQVPLPAGIFITPSIAFAGEIYPLWVSKLIAHEVEVTAIDGRCRHEPYHLVKRDAAVYQVVFVSFPEVPIHVSVYQAEDDGLVSHQRLVMAFAIRDGFLVAAAVFHFPEYAAGLPVLVAHFLDGLYPIIGDVHGHPVVEAITAILEFGGQSRHAAHFLRDGDGVLVHFMYQAVGQCQVTDGIIVLMAIEIVSVVAESLAQSVAVVKHGCDTVKTEAIEVELL